MSRSIALRRLATSLALAGCLSSLAHAADKNDRPDPQPIESAVATTVFDGGVRRELTRGVYEVAYNPMDKSLYVASSQSIPGVKGGIIYKLDPVTLGITGLIHTDKKNFALALSPSGDTLWTTNSLQAGISKIDVKTGDVVGRLKFDDKSADGHPYGPRQVIYDPAADLLYVGAVGNPGIIWVVNASDMTLKAKVANAGKWVTGLLRDPDSKRLYAANGDGEVLVIDTDKFEIVERWKPEDGKEHLLLNLALDPKTHRLFVTDDSKAKTVLVFDTRTGKVAETLPVGDSMGIKFNPIRNELYISHRNQGTVSVVDATSYKTLKTYSLPTNPNSLWVDPTGQVLYVSIKEAFAKDYSIVKDESVARIELDKK